MIKLGKTESVKREMLTKELDKNLDELDLVHRQIIEKA